MRRKAGQETELWCSQPDNLGFAHPIFSSCYLPMRETEKSVYKKVDGRAVLQMGTMPDLDDPHGTPIPLPFGSRARLLLMFAMTEAKRTRSPVVSLGSTFNEFCHSAGITPNGRNIHSIKTQLYRLANTWVRIKHPSENGLDPRQQYFLFNRVVFIQETRSDGRQLTLFPQQMEFNHSVYKAIEETAFPFDLDAFKALKRSPRQMDLYLFLVYRLFRLSISRQTTARIGWDGLISQFTQDGAERRSFRQKFERDVMKVIDVAYPTARVRLDQDGLLMAPSKLAIPPSL